MRPLAECVCVCLLLVFYYLFWYFCILFFCFLFLFCASLFWLSWRVFNLIIYHCIPHVISCSLVSLSSSLRLFCQPLPPVPPHTLHKDCDHLRRLHMMMNMHRQIFYILYLFVAPSERQLVASSRCGISRNDKLATKLKRGGKTPIGQLVRPRPGDDIIERTNHAAPFRVLHKFHESTTHFGRHKLILLSNQPQTLHTDRYGVFRNFNWIYSS